MGLVDKIANSLANGINKTADVGSKTVREGVQFAFLGNRYFPDADLEVRGYTNSGNLHIGLYPDNVCVESRNKITRVLGQGAPSSLLSNIAPLGSASKRFPIRMVGIVSVEPITLTSSLVTINVIGSPKIEFKATPAEARAINDYIAAHR